MVANELRTQTESEQSLAIRYAELLRLREAVREAESRIGRGMVDQPASKASLRVGKTVLRRVAN